jgi:DNA polymerase-1
MKKTLYLIDGYGLIYRSYFAFTGRHLYAPDGKNVSALFGFFRTLFALLRNRDVPLIAVALDPLDKTFRHEMYPEYKATRDKTPEELHDQIPLIETLLESLGIPQLRVDGFEADDLLGTLATRSTNEGRLCVIVSGDKDILQLVGESVLVLRPSKGELLEFGPQQVREEWGVPPEGIIDYLALTGDASDNIPGVAGIGPKTAVKLLEDFGNIDTLYASLDRAGTPAMINKLASGRDSAFLSRTLATIRRDVPLDFDPETARFAPRDPEAAVRLFLETGLKQLAADLSKMTGAAETPVPSPQGELFDVPSGGVHPSAAVNAVKGIYRAVLTETDLDDWIARAEKAGIFAFDSETDSLDSLHAEPVGFSLSVAPGEGCYIPLKCFDARCLERELVLSRLRPLLENPAHLLVGQNFKYDWHVLTGAGINPAARCFDTMIAAWLLDPAGAHNMDDLAEKYLGYKTIHFKDIVPKGGTFDQVPLAQAVEYAAEDADITFRLYDVFRPKLAERDMEKLFYELEMPLLPLLARMEREGIILNRDKLKVIEKELKISLAGLEEEIYLLCGKIFNINSTKQLQTILFEERKLTPVKKTMTGYSTDTAVLMELAKEDPVPAKIVDYRVLAKLKNTYVEALPLLISPRTGRLHTHFIQTGTETGRLSSKNPNLQNIPIRDENGRRIRSAFEPREDWSFVSADYSQIELVVLAHLSEDPELVKAFREGRDIHTQTAGLIFNMPEAEVTAAQRRIAKTINFGVMYGMSSFRLAGELKIPRAEADSFIAAYFKRFAGVHRFVEETVSRAETEGGVKTMAGRFRPLPEINSRNRNEKNGAARAAVNTRIQGSAADIVKKAMLAIDKMLLTGGSSARLLLQVHDECILEVPDADVPLIVPRLKAVMEGAETLIVPLKVNVETGKSWGNIH